MRILAVVTARGGSKRLPGKNIRLLGGRPLIAWSIDAVKDVAEIVDVLVSTDDHRIAEIARAAGALTPWLRPAELSTDRAASVDVCVHALDWYERERGAVDGLLLLQPTSPFRRRVTVERGIALFRDHDRRTVVSVSEAHTHPLDCVLIEGGHVRPFVAGAGEYARSQDLPPAYEITGALYLIAPHELRSARSFLGPATVPLITEKPEEAIDIDTEWDWDIAEVMMERRVKATSEGRTTE